MAFRSESVHLTRLGSPLRDRTSAFLIVGFIAGALYLNALPNQFAYDDHHIISVNTAIHSIETLPGSLVAPYWPDEYGEELGLWRPVTTGLLGIQYILGGGDALLFHTVNLLIHMVTSVLVLALLLELMSLAAAFVGALVFAVHPVHVEAVANIVGFSELLSTAAIIGACLLHIRAGPRSDWRSALAIGGLYLIGFGAKESGVTLPGLIFLLDAARGRISISDVPRYVADRWRTYLVMLCVAIGLLAGRFAILGSIASPFAPVGAEVLLEIPRIWTLSDVWMHYVRLWVFPLDLSADYSPNIIPVSFGWRAESIVGAFLALLVLGIAFVAWRRPDMKGGSDTSKAAAFGVVWFMISISPTSNTLFLSGVLMAERVLYLPSVGLAAATGWLIVRLAQDRRRLAWGGLCVAVIASSVRVWTRNPTWHDTDTMIAVLIRDYPYTGRSQWALGDQFFLRGRESEGLRAYRAAVDLLGPQHALILTVAGHMMAMERYPPAETLLGSLTREQPEFPHAFRMLADLRAEYGDAFGTEEYAREALALRDVDPTRAHLLAWALAAQGRYDEALEAKEDALEQGGAIFWQAYVYEAYMADRRGDTVRALAAVDTAWAQVLTNIGRATLDSVRVADFGLQPLLPDSLAVGSLVSGRDPNR
jgi:tetratricopeptide (TPR) repeat protein